MLRPLPPFSVSFSIVREMSARLKRRTEGFQPPPALLGVVSQIAGHAFQESRVSIGRDGANARLPQHFPAATPASHAAWSSEESPDQPPSGHCFAFLQPGTPRLPRFQDDGQREMAGQPPPPPVFTTIMAMPAHLIVRQGFLLGGQEEYFSPPLATPGVPRRRRHSRPPEGTAASFGQPRLPPPPPASPPCLREGDRDELGRLWEANRPGSASAAGRGMTGATACRHCQGHAFRDWHWENNTKPENKCLILPFTPGFMPGAFSAC